MTKEQEEQHKSYIKGGYQFYRATYDLTIGGRKSAKCNLVVRNNVPIPILKETIFALCKGSMGEPDIDSLCVPSYIHVPDKKEEKRAVFINEQERNAYFKNKS